MLAVEPMEVEKAAKSRVPQSRAAARSMPASSSFSGTESMETMERIADELEIRTTDELVEFNPDYNIGIINIGRG